MAFLRRLNKHLTSGCNHSIDFLHAPSLPAPLSVNCWLACALLYIKRVCATMLLLRDEKEEWQNVYTAEKAIQKIEAERKYFQNILPQHSAFSLTMTSFSTNWIQFPFIFPLTWHTTIKRKLLLNLAKRKFSFKPLAIISHCSAEKIATELLLEWFWLGISVTVPIALLAANLLRLPDKTQVKSLGQQIRDDKD